MKKNDTTRSKASVSIRFPYLDNPLTKSHTRTVPRTPKREIASVLTSYPASTPSP